jgi:hypothetical protein
VVLGRNKYYTPTSSTHPLFDPFIVDPINPQTAVISVLQITTSPRHGGSARGYLYIRKLTIHVRKLLEQLSKLGLPKKKGSKQKAPPSVLQSKSYTFRSASTRVMNHSMGGRCPPAGKRTSQ